MFDEQPDDSEKQQTESEKDKGHHGGQLTDEDFGDDEVERITGGDPEKTSNSEEQAENQKEEAARMPNVDSNGETVYSD